MIDYSFLYQGKSHHFVEQHMLHLGYDPHHFGRFPTMKIALNYYMQTGGKYIVETGCQRDSDLAGSGGSTVIFSNYVETYGGEFDSVDISQDSVDFATNLIGANKNVRFTCQDSLEFFKNRKLSIDLLYLDSYDYPYGTLLEAYGGKEDLNKAIHDLQQVSEDEIVDRFYNVIYPSQNHCLEEVMLADTWLTTNAVIVIDDAMIPGGGKARLARDWLLKDGDWRLLLAGYQQVFIRNLYV